VLPLVIEQLSHPQLTCWQLTVLLLLLLLLPLVLQCCRW
jgi:hypothetical protein